MDLRRMDASGRAPTRTSALLKVAFPWSVARAWLLFFQPTFGTRLLRQVFPANSLPVPLAAQHPYQASVSLTIAQSS
eukprot:2914597-Pleurochrysis_carterae.AAC.2